MIQGFCLECLKNFSECSFASIFTSAHNCWVIFKKVAFLKVFLHVHVARVAFVSACARKDHSIQFILDE